MSQLGYLDIHGNALRTIPQFVFEGLSSLYFLNLNGTYITEFPQGLFAGLSNLTSMQLGANSLTTLPVRIFEDQSRLEWLSLTNNSLGRLPGDVFGGLSSLKTLYLTGNSLESLPDGLFSGLVRLESVDLRANPGAPFALTLEIVRVDSSALSDPGPATLALRLKTGSPFDLTGSLVADGGTLSAPTATIPVGSTTSPHLELSPSGQDTATVRFAATLDVPTTQCNQYGSLAPCFQGVALAPGPPLRLFGPDLPPIPAPTGDGDNVRRSLISRARVGATDTAFDVNGCDAGTPDDALVLYYSLALESLVGDGTPGTGVPRFRDALLSGRACGGIAGDAELRSMVAQALQAAETPILDTNGTGAVSANEALILYYSLALETLLGDGTPGTGIERFRKALLVGRRAD